MNPAEEVERTLRNSVSQALDGVSEVLSSCDESHADQQEGHTEPVVKPEHKIINPGRIMFGDDGLQWLYNAVHDVVLRGALPSDRGSQSCQAAKPLTVCWLCAGWRPLYSPVQPSETSCPAPDQFPDLRVRDLV